ncbi:hypothetical protein CPB84DRAFT_1772795, partial [Gymnopilus junonius]
MNWSILSFSTTIQYAFCPSLAFGSLILWIGINAGRDTTALLKLTPSCSLVQLNESYIFLSHDFDSTGLRVSRR